MIPTRIVLPPKTEARPTATHSRAGWYDKNSAKGIDKPSGIGYNVSNGEATMTVASSCFYLKKITAVVEDGRLSFFTVIVIPM